MRELSSLALFWWGALGGGAAFLLVVVLPYAVKLLVLEEDDPRLKLTRRRLAGYLLFLLVNLLFGGLAAELIGSAIYPRQAIVYGLAWQSIMNGAGNVIESAASAKTETEQARALRTDNDGAPGVDTPPESQGQ